MLNRSRRTIRLAVLMPLLAATMTHPDPAFAQEGPLDDATKEKAEQLRRQGNALSRQGQVEEAIDAYKAAFDLHPTAATAANLGALELTVRKPRDAAEHLAFAQRRCGLDCPQTLRQAVAEKLAQAQGEVGKLTVVPSVAQARVTMDGRFATWINPSEMYVEPGAHTVEAALSGYATARQIVEIKGGESQTIRLLLEPLVAGATVQRTPSEVTGEPATSTWKRRSTLVLTGAGITLVGLGLGIGFTVAANDRSSQAISQREELRAKSGPTACSSSFPENTAACARLQGTWYDWSTYTNVAGWSFLSAGVVALATGIYALWPSAENDRSGSSARLVPVVGPREGGLRLEAVF